MAAPLWVAILICRSQGISLPLGGARLLSVGRCRMAQKIFFITGVSSGLGRALAEEALAAGHRVAGTVRTDDACLEVEQLKPGRAFAKMMDGSRREVGGT